MGFRSVLEEGLAVTGLNSWWSSHLSMKEIIPLFLVQQTHKISPRVGLMLQPNCLNSVQKYPTKSLGVVVGGVWEGLVIDKNMGFVSL